MDIEFIFDTTGSMYPCLGEVRRKLTDTVNRLFTLVPDIRISVMAQGDYCDARSTYVTSILDFTTDKKTIIDFINNVKPTGGGDSPECYELSLHQSRSLDWISDKKVIVLIADDVPHGVNYPQNTLKLSWKEEAIRLVSSGITVYPVQCLRRSDSDYFYNELANISGVNKLTLDQFSSITEFILAITYKQVDQLETYQEELETKMLMNRSIAKMFQDLGTNVKIKEIFTKKVNDLVPVDPSRFQVLMVDRDIDIKGFVLSSGAVFKLGRGFYQFTKSEEIQEKKEVILRHKVTGDFFTGDKVREMIGLPYGTRGTIRPKYFEEYEVYVQSTSNNRKLLRNTKFLYEAKEKD